MLRRYALSRVLLLLALWLGVACHSVAVQENSEPDEVFAVYLLSETEDLRAFTRPETVDLCGSTANQLRLLRLHSIPCKVMA